MNLETIIDLQSWCRTWPLNGSSRIRAKQKLQETQRSLQKFLDPNRKPKVIYTDNSLEFGKACEDLSWNHCTSTPLSSETNGIVERAVRRVKEGTSAVLLQSGLDENWWADSMECYTYLRNIQGLLAAGKTLYERRFGKPFKGASIPFGSLVEYHPITAKDQSRIHQFGKKVLPGLFLGYALYAGSQVARGAEARPLHRLGHESPTARSGIDLQEPSGGARVHSFCMARRARPSKSVSGRLRQGPLSAPLSRGW